MSHLSGIQSIAEMYDTWIVDLWGTVHDGAQLYPEAAHTLEQLVQSGKNVFLLSNAPRLKQTVQADLQKMGLSTKHFTDLHTSGQEALQRLPQWTKEGKIGQKYFYLGPSARHDCLLTALPQQLVNTLEEADFILITGPQDNRHLITHYDKLFENALNFSLTMVCVNPDVFVENGPLCAGAFAKRYQKMGGNVHFIGKPEVQIYHSIPGLLHSRCIAIGDNPATDIQGAHQLGIDSALVLTGLGTNLKHFEMDLLPPHHAPTFVLPAFKWSTN